MNFIEPIDWLILPTTATSIPILLYIHLELLNPTLNLGVNT